VLAVAIRTATGDRVESASLDPALFEVTPNVPVMHQVVTAQLAAARAGTQSTLTRAEVKGGGRKPWRQKGSGRARQGSIRAPQWVGGGVALGPKPRSYKQRTPKKMIQLALRSALSDRAAEGKVAVVERWQFSEPRTREADAALRALGLDGKVLVVLSPDDEVAAKSFRNIPRVHVLLASELNTYDILCADWLLFTRATLPGETSEAGTAAPSEPEPQAAAPSEPEPQAAAPSEPEADAAPPADAAPAAEPEVEPEAESTTEASAPPANEPDWDAPVRGENKGGFFEDDK
jgi:large subunit ribosomal protein L4